MVVLWGCRDGDGSNEREEGGEQLHLDWVSVIISGIVKRYEQVEGL